MIQNYPTPDSINTQTPKRRKELRSMIEKSYACVTKPCQKKEKENEKPLSTISEDQPKSDKKSKRELYAEWNVRSFTERRKLVFVAGNLLSYVTLVNDKFHGQGREAITRFHSQCIPKFSIISYFQRISQYALCSNETFIFALIYIDRVLASCPSILLTSLNIHRMFLTSVLIAGKYNDDCFFANSHYARIGGISCTEMTNLEREFLAYLKYDLSVPLSTYDYYTKNLDSFLKKVSSLPHEKTIKYPFMSLIHLMSTMTINQNII
ncbi:negative regulatory factor [Rozella allomycis CSF55]|uniref:Cyclin PHO80-like domain-containing protein n=1 Tax=Rozella allomycis (strain CSF55) TaxID=988480 RepID=A0A075ATS4_ROZAC|nr:Cyclin PHO80-like domain-containing protein [Rozella allomycis CSF55]RKP17140.1 negative regulatory factor [Rozella allomycis CSF55]|eukprot:EPZ32090.1 Cyclin PHO80-like domain-containing protein [Rozella allomycis CSF55]